MATWLTGLAASVGTLIVTLIVTFAFNKVVALPNIVKEQKALVKAQEEQQKRDDYNRDIKIADLEQTLQDLANWRNQSISIQKQLREADTHIMQACEKINETMIANQELLTDRLDKLESRDKNSIRSDLLDAYRLFTNKDKNPMLAWTEMEHHAFFELVRDYEDLNGNDYIHTIVIPEINKLDVISLNDKTTLNELMSSRKF